MSELDPAVIAGAFDAAYLEYAAAYDETRDHTASLNAAVRRAAAVIVVSVANNTIAGQRGYGAPKSGPVASSASNCRNREAGRPCLVCNHENCGWCPECHPEVPEW